MRCKSTLSLTIAILGICIGVPSLASASTPTNGIVPEPATWLLLGSGLAGLAAYKWYKSR